MKEMFSKVLKRHRGIEERRSYREGRCGEPGQGVRGLTCVLA